MRLDLKSYVELIKPFLSGFLGAALFVLIYQAYQTPLAIGSVNINRLVNDHIKARAHSPLNKAELEKDSQQFIMKLEGALQLLAQKKHLCLIISEAVILGTKDYTEQIRQQLDGRS